MNYEEMFIMISPDFTVMNVSATDDISGCHP